MAEGWIKLHRDIQDHWLWKDEPYDKARAWIDLIMLANWEDKKTAFKGEIVTCKRGDVNLSFLHLADRWKWSTWKVRNFIELLEKDGMVTTSRTTHRTTITIVNYEVYQNVPTTDCTTNLLADHTTDHTTSQQQATTTKKEKNNKEVKNNTPKGVYARFVPPTLDEVKKYCAERNNTVDAEKWFDFYESKGWMIGKNKMKDWKSAVRTWERSSNSNGFRSTEDEVSTSKYPSFKLWD